MGIAITVALLAVNAFFVAGGLRSPPTRRSQVEPLADEGARGSALYAPGHVSLMLAICQLALRSHPRRWASSPNLRLRTSSVRR